MQNIMLSSCVFIFIDKTCKQFEPFKKCNSVEICYKQQLIKGSL